MLGRKRVREEPREIELKIGRKKEVFDSISYRLNKAEEIFKQYALVKKKNEKWKIMKQVLDLVEINPRYNTEFLKVHNDKAGYKEDFQQLSPTLSEAEYLSVCKKKQKNPSEELFDLLNLYLQDEEKFEEETKKIIYHNYNIPLIEGNERLRVNYYIQLLQHFEKSLNDNQKNYLLNPKKKISKDELERLTTLKDKYISIKNEINLFEEIIPKMKKFFLGIKMEENDLNIKIFTFMLYLIDIAERIWPTSNNFLKILNFFEKEINPTKEFSKINSLNSNIDNRISSINSGIKKKYNNKEIKKNDKFRVQKMNKYIIYNRFESIEFDGRNYVVENLLNEYKDNACIPLNILLLRNQSLSYFIKENNNFLNVKENIFNEFKEYFKFFIRSRSFQEALSKHKKYINIISLVNDDNIINKILSEKYLKSIPLFEFAGSGYTNKDILVSCVSGFPFIIYNYKIPKSKEDYELLKGIFILFNVAMKLITSVHEIIIHLFFSYLNYVSEGKIDSHSPKKAIKVQSDDGGFLFENILFGCVYGYITLNEVLVILNGDCNNSLANFQANLKKNFDYTSFVLKSKLLKLIFKEYKIDLNLLNINKKVYSTLKSSENSIYIKRNPMNVLLPFKKATPNDQ